jgi:hypothetical protein
VADAVDPIYIAIAAFITAVTPACVTVILSYANGRKLDKINEQTDGHLTRLTKENVDLHRANASLESGKYPPDEK